MSDIAIFTISSGNYFPQAKTFLDSVYTQHPEIDLYFFLADEISPVIVENSTHFNVVSAHQLKIEKFEHFSFKYSIVEFNTAIKPFCFEFLVQKQQYKKIIFFDPDIYVFNNLEMIFHLLNVHSIILTPHLANKNFAVNNFVNHEFSILRYGIFNLGFLAIRVDNESINMIKWLKLRCNNNCYIFKNEATYVDQKWANFIPSLFDNVFITRHLGCNMAYWNIHERTVSANFKVNDQDDLLFFHFSGFDKANDSAITSNPVLNTDLRERTDLIPIFDIYRKALLENLVLTNKIPEYKYLRFNNGQLISDYHRTIFQYVSCNYSNPFEVKKQSYFQFIKKRKRVSSLNCEQADFTIKMWLGEKRNYWYIKIFTKIFFMMHKTLGSVKFYALINQAKNYFAFLGSNAFILHKDKRKK